MFWLKIVQLIIAIALILVVLLQNKGSGMSGLFGGGGNVYMAKRGFDKILFIATIVIAAIFFSFSLAIILL